MTNIHRTATTPVREAVSPPDDVPPARIDSSPLRLEDPLRIDGFRTVARLVSGGMADVFYALTPNGDPLAIEVLRAADGAPDTCRREYVLAPNSGHQLHSGRCT